MTYLLGVEGVKLRLAVVQSRQTDDLRLGAVRDVDQLLVPPTITDGASDAAQDQAVITNLPQTHKYVTDGASDAAENQAVVTNLQQTQKTQIRHR